MAKAGSTEKVVREIRRQTRRRFSAVRLEFPIFSLNPGLRPRGVAPDVWPTLPVRCPPCGRRRAPRSPRRRAPSQASATGSGHWRHPWRCGRLSGAGSRMWRRRRGRAPWADGGPGGARVSSARPAGCRVSSPVSPDVPPALTRWCAARGGEAVWCAGRRCRLGGASCHAASPVRAAPERRPAGRRPRAVPVR